MRNIFLGFIVIVCVLLPFYLKAEENTDSVRVLFIGNSYTHYHDLPEMVRQIASHAGMHEKMKISSTSFTPGGCTFKKHLENPELLKALGNGKWDFVILQEQSTAPAKSTKSVIENVYPYAARLDSLANSGNPDAKVIFYMTWGHKDGFAPAAEYYPLITTYEGMQDRLITSYIEMAQENDAMCAPVGMAWKRVREERPYNTLYWPDRSHPSRLGTYLAANVIYTTMLGKPYQSTWTDNLDPELAEYIQQVAQRTVFDNKHLFNIK
ncbi:MAG: SGNH/GDSL hydrolase family protein [Muribaculaceae bacterium]|nr:SGNH/GDSL hydrolase family protein [Muribaculaceae bacterium]